MPSSNFKSKAAYLAWLAYVKMHNLTKNKRKITIQGKPHKVNHLK